MWKAIDRRTIGTLIGSMAAAGAMATLGPGTGRAQQAPAGRPSSNTVLRMQAAWPASLTLYENFTYFADRVGKLSAGMLTINTMPAGQVVPPFELLDAVSRRVVDGSHSWAGYWTGKDRTAILFTGGPGGTFGMDFIDVMGWLHHGGGLELYQEFYTKVLKLDVVPIPILPSGPQAFGWFNRPITNLNDLKGLKCRQTGLAAEVWKELGMTVVNMPGGEIIPAAQRGVIDCAEWVGGVEDIRLGFQNVWKFHYSPGVHENVTIGELLINGEVWRALAPQHQEIIKSAARDAFIVWWPKWQKQNAEALFEMREKYGVQLLRTPGDVLRAFLEKWDEIAAREAAQNPFFKKVWDSQREYARVVVPAKRFYFPPYSFIASIYWPEGFGADPASTGTGRG
ncbi:TRAP-type mannitol/chloroaromatic compound transport system substrate-binding protein [Bradyrhizobium sp. AZCC 1588]|uniref:TRAP transporter substrate-binding protein n=1 Tax=unclassified Bradyrhizobium TaxID=2631580 RepID=UPI002FF431C7